MGFNTDIQNNQGNKNKCYQFHGRVICCHMSDILLSIDRIILIMSNNSYLVLYYMLIISGIEVNPGPGDANTRERKRVRKSGVRYKTYLTNRSSLEDAPASLKTQAEMQVNILEEGTDIPNLSNQTPMYEEQTIIEPFSQAVDLLVEECVMANDVSEDGSDIWSEDDLLNSDSESEQESERTDLNGQISDEDFNKLPIYEGTQLTLGESILLIMTFALTHNLTGKAFSDFLDVIRLHCKESNLLPSTVYELKQWYQGLKIAPLKHYYCGECLLSLKEDTAVCPNSKCNKRFKNIGDKSFFVEISLVEQIKKLYSEADFRKNLVNNDVLRTAYPLRDIYDGEYYRQITMNDNATDRLTFTWNTDGVPLFKSSKTSMWPFFLAVNELPFKLRRQPENLLLVGLWIGPKKPEMLTFLKPFIDDLQQLENGINVLIDNNTTVTLHCSLVAGTADLPAKCIVHNMIQFNGKYSCPYCEQPGETAKSGKGVSHIYPFIFDGPTEPKRTHNNTIHFAEIATENMKSEMGIKGPCWFSQCESYDVIKSNCVDYMHCVLLGVMKRLISIWFYKEFSNDQSSFYDKIDEVNLRLLKLKPPYFIRRAPRSLNDLKYWKASEFRSFLLFYGPVILSDILSHSYYSHFLLLSEAVYLILQETITLEEVNLAENLLEKFLATFGTLYDKRFMTLNFHLLLHLPDNVRQLGPLWAYSCFPFEDANGFLLKLVKGTQSVHSQLVDTMSIMHGIPYLEKTVVKDGSEVHHLLTKMKTSDSKRKTQLGKDIFALGKMTKINVNDLSRDCFSALAKFLNDTVPTGHVYKFKRIKLYNRVYHSIEYTRVTVRNSYTIRFKDIDGFDYGLINYFLLYQPDENENTRSLALAVISKLQPNNDITKQFPYDDVLDRYQMSHFHKFDAPQINDRKQAINVDAIEGLCINLKSRLTDIVYICRPPNSVELE